MKKNMIFIALAALLLPAIARSLWFYRGVSSRPSFATPDYQSLVAPQPHIEAPSDDSQEIEQVGGVVILDVIHANQFQSADISSLSQQIERRGGYIESLTDPIFLETKLKYASAFIIVSPTILYTPDEMRVIHAFINRGGKLIVFTDATRNLIGFDFLSGAVTAFGDVNVVNPILSPFGIIINNDYLYNTTTNEGNFRNIFFDDFGKSELTFGLKEVTLYGTHSVKSSSGLILLRGSESTLSSTDDANDPAAGGAALSENENVIAFGDFTFLTSPYNGYSDNATLIANLADFALSGGQTSSLARFPYIFSNDVVQAYLSSEIKMTPEMISALGRMQSSLQYLNIQMEIADKAPTEGNVITFGTFVPSEDLTSYTDPFNLEFDDENDSVTVPGFGNVSRTGNGLILFSHGKKGTSITLLADTPEDLIVLLDTAASGYLYGCVLQNDIGVCGVGYSDSSIFTDELSQDSFATETTTAENATATPPASGQYNP